MGRFITNKSMKNIKIRLMRGLSVKGFIYTLLISTHFHYFLLFLHLGLSFFTVITLFMNPLLEATILKVGGFLLFLGVAFGLVYFLSKITKFVLKMHIDESEFSLALVLVLALAYFTEVIGFSSVLGAFIAGVLVAKMPFADTRSFTDKIKSVSFGLFIPLFFVWFGLEIDLVEI